MDTINFITTRQNTLKNPNKIREVKEQLAHVSNSSLCPITSCYKEHFNMVDLFDRSWYSIDDHHRVQNWRKKLLFNLMRVGTINAWTLSLTTEFSTLENWREKLIESLGKLL